MPTDFAFRLSTYLTLALACGSLAYAEYNFLPEAAGFGGLMVLCIGLAFWADRTGRELSLGAANWVGFGLSVVAVGWIGYHLATLHPLLNVFPAGLLPFLGPVLMMAMCAKLFRPKHVGDWWGLQFIGLASVGLAAAITDDEPFVALLLAYVWAVVWSLTLFFVRRASGYVDPVPVYTHFQARAVRWVLGAVSPSLADVPPPHRPTVAVPFAGVGQPTPTERLGRSHLFRAAGWLTAAVLLTLPLFLVTPRSAGLQWELFKPRLETGLPTDNTLDLSRTGELKPNPEPAFDVIARYPDGRPKTDLAPGVRWRVAAFTEYAYPKGVFKRVQASDSLYAAVEAVAEQTAWLQVATPEPRFPDLGPDQFVLEFTLARRMVGSYPLLDPVSVRPGQPPPVVYPIDGGYRYALRGQSGAYLILPPPRGGPRTTTYLQASAAGPLDDLTGPFAGPNTSPADRTAPLLRAESPRIADFTRQLLNRLIDQGRLPAGVRDRRDPYDFRPNEADHAAIARAIRDHLAESGVYTYTLNLRLQDKSADPVEDFLFNTKEGHCERFAAALVLMLRSIGIPCQFVVGFKGCEPLSDGMYAVRQEHAHAWAEVLTWTPSNRPPAPGTDGRDWYWLSLDPTPDIGGDGENPQTLAANAPLTGRKLIADLLLGLNPEMQRRLSEGAAELAAEYGRPVFVGLLVVGLLVVGWLAYRRVAARPAYQPPPLDTDAPWYSRMVERLTAAGHPSPAGRTPNEYAAAVSIALAANPRTAAVADVPAVVAGLVYAARYAGREPTPDELSIVDAALARLAAALPKGDDR